MVYEAQHLQEHSFNLDRSDRGRLGKDWKEIRTETGTMQSQFGCFALFVARSFSGGILVQLRGLKDVNRNSKRVFRNTSTWFMYLPRVLGKYPFGYVRKN